MQTARMPGIARSFGAYVVLADIGLWLFVVPVQFTSAL